MSAAQAPAAGLPWVVSVMQVRDGLQHMSSARTLTETDLVHYCMLSGDWHELHASRVGMRSSAVGERMFAGTFGVMLSVAQAGQALQFVEPIVAASGVTDWKYHAPLRIGATVRTRITVKAVERHRSKPRVQVVRHLDLVDENDTVLQSGIAGLWLDAESGQRQED